MLLKKKVPVFFLLGLSLLAGACTPSRKSPADTLTTIIANPIQTLNPLYTTDANSQHINELLHGALMITNESLEPAPYLAESFKIINPTTLEFRLRSGCVFPSGREITTEDVKKTLDFYRDPANQSTFAETFQAIKKMEIIDKQTFRFITAAPTPSLLSNLDVLKILDLSQIKAGEKPTSIPGAGPFALEAESVSQISLVRRPQPCLPLPPLKKIKIKVVRDDLSRFFKLRTGEIDFILNEMNFRKVESIANDPSLPIKVATSDGISYTYMGLNLENKKLQDLRVRRALALSFDIPEILRYKNRGMAKQARNLLAEQNFYSNPNVPLVTRDLELAKKLLDEAGYSNGHNGKPPLQLVIKTNTNNISIENARVLAAQAKEAGIELKYQANDWGIFYNDVKTGNVELYLLRWVGVTDPHIYFELFHSGEISRNNRTRYKNPQLDQLLEAAESTMDKKKRREIYFQVQEIVAKDLPYIGLWHNMNAAVFREEVKGLSLHPAGKWISLLSLRKE